MKQRIVVLGAGGFIGRHVVSALAATSWATPVAATHRASTAPAGCDSVALDATDTAALTAALAGADAVVNCVAGSPRTIVATTRALIDAATAQPRAPRVIQLSSMAVYGAAVGIVDEAARLRADLGPYGAAKIEAEQLAASYPRLVTLRPGCVYGPGSAQWSVRIARWLRAHRVGDLGAAGDGCCNLVHVDDVVAAIVAALRTDGVEGQAFNLGSAAPPTWNEYFVAFGIALGAVPVQRVPKWRLALETKLLAPILKIIEIAAARIGLRRWRFPEPIPPSLLRAWGQELRLDVSKAQRMLGLRWTPEAAGLQDTAAQLRRAGVA